MRAWNCRNEETSRESYSHAALGAAAYAGIPLTHRAHASAVALVTGHESPSKSDSALDWEALARFPGTLVIYMGISRLAQIACKLIDHGKPADTPAAVVQWCTTGDQRAVEAIGIGRSDALELKQTRARNGQ